MWESNHRDGPTALKTFRIVKFPFTYKNVKSLCHERTQLLHISLQTLLSVSPDIEGGMQTFQTAGHMRVHVNVKHTHNKIITSCYFVHNYSNKEMVTGYIN